MWASGVKASGGFQSSCKIQQNAAVTANPSTWVKSPFERVDWDVLGEVDFTTNKRWNAAADGVYEIVAVGSIKNVPGTAGKGCIVQLYKNGSVLQSNGWDELGAPSQNIGTYGGRTASIAITTLALSAGDYIEVYMYHNHTGPLLIEGCNYCTIKRIA